MNIILLGTGVAIPQLEKAQSGILVKTPEELVLFDCGAGILSRIVQSGYDYLKIHKVFFTHNHLDHNSDFLALLKAQQLATIDTNIPAQTMNVFGPAGTKHHVEQLLDLYDYITVKVAITELEDGESIRVGNSVVSVHTTKHGVPSIAYRMQTPTSTLVYSGDTEPCEGVRELCHGEVDVLIHECSFPDSYASVSNHTTPSKLRDLIFDQQIDRIVLTHLYPHASGQEDVMVDVVKEKFLGRVDVAHDLMKIYL
ncbi:MAG TPA: ribonuclease Z [archaeon]|jgi:ribonuclease BN (tRNA processing enzyme)